MYKTQKQKSDLRRELYGFVDGIVQELGVSPNFTEVKLRAIRSGKRKKLVLTVISRQPHEKSKILILTMQGST
jgi:hypothetical protein